MVNQRGIHLYKFARVQVHSHTHTSMGKGKEQEKSERNTSKTKKKFKTLKELLPLVLWAARSRRTPTSVLRPKPRNPPTPSGLHSRASMSTRVRPPPSPSPT